MKRLLRSITAGILLLTVSLNACKQEVYETGDGELSYLRTDYVTLSLSHNLVTAIETDAGVHLPFPTGYSVAGEWRADTTLRSFLHYTQKPGEAIQILAIKPVAVLEPYDYAKVSRMNTDPVKLTSISLSDNKKYINLSLGLLTGNDKPAGSIHQLAFRLDKVSDQGKGREWITLCHDQDNVPEYYTMDVLLSLKMPQRDTVTIKINTYNGVEERTFCR